MKIYLTPPQPSLGLERIATALRRYAPPHVSISTFPRNVDLTVIYAIGRRDAIQRQVEDILSRGKKYAIIQVCLKSTMTPDPWDWMQIWEGATVVWSYYDLDRMLNEDNDDPSTKFHMPCEFYHAPLGVDAEVFYPRMPVTAIQALFSKTFIVATSGSSRLQESVRECELAAEQVSGRMFHLGRRVTGKNHVVCDKDLSDDDLAAYFSDCEFVSGLRRTEGFELPAAEGLLCGARPIVFDTPDYHWNYGPHAEYIKETDRQGVVDQLVELFKRGARPVTAEEREQAVERFNWEKIVGGFYERLL